MNALLDLFFTALYVVLKKFLLHCRHLVMIDYFIILVINHPHLISEETKEETGCTSLKSQLARDLWLKQLPNSNYSNGLL